MAYPARWHPGTSAYPEQSDSDERPQDRGFVAEAPLRRDGCSPRRRPCDEGGVSHGSTTARPERPPWACLRGGYRVSIPQG
jgi:hypothetical protein